MARETTRVVPRESADRAWAKCGKQVEEFLDSAKRAPEIVGGGLGEEGGQPRALILLEHETEARIPRAFGGIATKTMVVGKVSPDAVAPLRARRRPMVGGISVGDANVGTGTIACGVYDMLPGSNLAPPMQGIGFPPTFYILSCNNVLANANQAPIGNAIFQPGLAFAAGAGNVVATLSRFVPLDLTPAKPLQQHNNLVDAAVAQVLDSQDIDREVHWIGRVDGWRQFAQLGQLVRKTGCISNYTQGRIIGLNAIMDVGPFAGGGTARFRDQIVTTQMTVPGDSGSLLMALDLPQPRNVALGLLFASTVPPAPNGISIACRIDNVRRLLRVETGEGLF